MGRRVVRVLVVVLAVAACGPGASSLPPSASPPAAVASPAASALASASEADRLLADLDKLDRAVRGVHPGKFRIHPESEWIAALASARAKVASASADARIALVASVAGLLDSHTYVWRNAGFHAYPVFLYHFVEGWFVIAAVDKTLIGAKLLSIGGRETAEVEATLRPLVPHDNEMGFLLNVQALLSNVEYLHGSGVVADPAAPQYVFALPNGTERTENFEPMEEGAWGEALHLVHTLVGAAPEAVRRNAELNWSRAEADGVFLIAVNDYGDETAVIDALDEALDAGTSDRLVLDVRYLPGGNGDFALLDVLKGDVRVNRPGGLTVLIGRENYSIADAIVRDFDVNSAALLIGEPTPALADNFRCTCYDIELPAFDLVVTVPTWRDNVGDERPQVEPDVRMDLAAADFFAGRDPVLEAALAGIDAP